MKRKELLHSRTITVNTYELSRDEILVEGILRDERSYPSSSVTRDFQVPPGTVHHMKIEMILVVPSLRVRSLRTEMPVHPFPECLEIQHAVRKLEGVQLMSEFSREVRIRIGGTSGCLHLRNLLLAMGSAAVQGAWAFFNRERAQKPAVPTASQLENRAELVVDSCWVWRKEGPLEAKLRRSIDEAGTAEKDGKES